MPFDCTKSLGKDSKSIERIKLFSPLYLTLQVQNFFKDLHAMFKLLNGLAKGSGGEGLQPRILT